MLPPGFFKFSVAMENITLLADSGDFFQLVGSTVPWVLLEVRVFQRGSTTIAMDSLLLHRGVGGAGGTGLTEFEVTSAGPAPTVVAASLPTTDVGTDDWQYRQGFNLLQEQVNLPIPELWVPFGANDDLGITRATTLAHTGVGVQVSWAEFVGN